MPFTDARTHARGSPRRPGFGKSLDERDLWRVTLFLKNMGELSPAPRQAWLGGTAEGTPR
jgi:hypothetical protein